MTGSSKMGNESAQVPRDTASAFAERTISGSQFKKKNEKPNFDGEWEKKTQLAACPGQAARSKS
jgi:hypothetical protein